MEIIAFGLRQKNEKFKPLMDEYTLESVYNKHYKNVYNYIAFRINNHHDTEELASQTFEKVIKSWGRYNPANPLEAWIITIAKNVVTDYFRKNARRQFISFDSLVQAISPNREPEEIVVASEENRALMMAMTRLKDKERQILSMKFATELKHSEIANILGIGENNVRVIVHRALKKLRNLLEEAEGDESK
ncbi:MAG: sigma-70 family RNA polymerase sigma factor [Defluviitaleaceae bacterium]|nr:sigma-70 family RNA polymerase sigma factor [Defluviitaleaceae bacterium]